MTCFKNEVQDRFQRILVPDTQNSYRSTQSKVFSSYYFGTKIGVPVGAFSIKPLRYLFHFLPGFVALALMVLHNSLFHKSG